MGTTIDLQIITFVAFIIAGILSVLSGFSYVELSTIFKTNDVEYDYISSVFVKKRIFQIPLQLARFYGTIQII